jgi:hypothetical protein
VKSQCEKLLVMKADCAEKFQTLQLGHGDFKSQVVILAQAKAYLEKVVASRGRHIGKL